MTKNGLLIPLVIVSVLLLGSLGFAFWAFIGMQDYKNNAQVKIDKAVEVAEENLSIKKDAEFAEEYKKPNTTYKGPSAYGTLTITYPKTWSNYVSQETGSNLLEGFMQPNYVPAHVDNTNYALRYQVTRSPYDQELKRFESLIRGGKVKASPYKSPKQETARAIKLEGEVEGQKQGTMVMIELRDKTIKIWTEGDQFKADYEKILEQFTFIQ